MTANMTPGRHPLKGTGSRGSVGNFITGLVGGTGNVLRKQGTANQKKRLRLS